MADISGSSYRSVFCIILEALKIICTDFESSVSTDKYTVQMALQLYID